MIIKKNINKEENKQQTTGVKKAGNIIKGGIKPAIQKEVQNTPIMPQAEQPEVIEKKVETPVVPKKTELEEKLIEFEKINVTELEFKERYERRRGERRRGFRRIDERALVSRAQEEAQAIRDMAKKEGYENGLKEANGEIELLKTSLSDFLSARKTVWEEASNHILEIALEVAKKIIKKEAQASDEVLKAVMSEVFDELNGGDEKITVKVNPEDVEAARNALPEILKDSTIDAKIVVIGDELVEKGSCTLIASNGVVDANFSTQLNIIQNAFGMYKGGD